MENISELVLAWQQSQPDPRTRGTPAPAAGPRQPRRGGTATAPPPATNPLLPVVDAYPNATDSQNTGANPRAVQ